jgi:hypothetical protein
MAIGSHHIGNYLKYLGLNHPIKERKLITITTCHQQGVLSYLPWWGRKIINFGPSFIIFGVLENLLWISKEFKSLWVFYKEFI